MIVIYDTNYTANPNAYIVNAIYRAARRTFGNDVVLADNSNLIPLSASVDRGLLICLDGQRLRHDIIARVRGCYEKTVLWLFEDPFMLDVNLASASYFDLVFTNDPGSREAYGSRGRHLPLAGCPYTHHRDVREDRDLSYDIFFAGTMWPNRVKTIRNVIGAFPHARMKLICPSNEHLPPIPADVARRSMPGPVSNGAFVDFANRSRVTLTLHRDFSGQGSRSLASAPGPRLYELSFAGACQLVDQRAPSPSGRVQGSQQGASGEAHGIAHLADEGELFAEMERILRLPRERLERARAAQSWASRGESYEHRLDQMVSHLRDREVAVRAPARPDRLPRILFCTHSTIRHDSWGGIEVYQHVVATRLGAECEFFYWLRRDGCCQLVDAADVVVEEFSIENAGWLDVLCDPKEEAAFSRIISEYAIDVVHVQHLAYHALSLPIIAKAAGAAVVFSAHDFFLVCSRYTLIGHDRRFCAIDRKTIIACDLCLHAAERVPSGAQSARRAFVEQVISCLDLVLYGTPGSKTLIETIYPRIAEKQNAVLGIPSPVARGSRPPATRRPVAAVPACGEGKLRIAVPGNFIVSKGADTVMQVLSLADPQRFHFCIMGKARSPHEEALKAWAAGNVEYLGGYELGDSSRLAESDAALFLSIWPESFSISLSEAWQNQVIPIASDIGAFADRVRHLETGLLVEVGSADQVIAALELLLSVPALRRSIRERIASDVLHVDPIEYCRHLKALYRGLVAPNRLASSNLTLDVGQLHILSHERWKEPRRCAAGGRDRRRYGVEAPTDLSMAVLRDCAHHLDRVGWAVDQEAADRSASLIAGWATCHPGSPPREIHVALVGKQFNLFPSTDRIPETSATKADAKAADSVGFSARLDIAGHWSDGRYRIVLLLRQRDRISICPTRYSVELADGRIARRSAGADDGAPAISNLIGRVEADRGSFFANHPLRALPMLYSLDEVDIEERTSSGRSKLRGWCFVPGMDAADATIFGLLFHERRRTSTLVFYDRFTRDDVAANVAGAPSDCGFDGRLPPRTGFPPGPLRLVLGCMNPGGICIAVTDRVLDQGNGRLEISSSDPSRELERAVRNSMHPRWYSRFSPL